VRAPHSDWRAWAFSLCAASIWFEALWRATRDAPASPLTPTLAAIVGLATQLTYTALEASLATAAWLSLGRSVRWSALAPALLTASVTEAFAVSVIAERPYWPQGWRVALAGARALPEHVAAGPLAQAFAGFGVLTLVRLVLATHAHADALRASAPHSTCASRRWRDAALLVLTFYAASRLAIWWGLDLFRGRSFEP
jgi:hypothetical protein